MSYKNQNDQMNTYIEARFKEICSKNQSGRDMFEEWEHMKREYCGKINTTIYEFMNYSLHDKSHSESILEKVEMLLGRNRINKLSKSDLWLMLSCAYSHDLGMATEYSELFDLWQDEDFLEYLQAMKESAYSDKDELRAVKNYSYFDWLLKGADENQRPEQLDDDMKSFYYKYTNQWPLDMRRDITLLMSSFIRKHHADRSKSQFENCLDYKTNLIPSRLYQAVGQINSLHMQEFSEVLKEMKSDNGGAGGGEDEKYIHPRFIAILLRLGDLLDLDNNRFDYYSVQHYGPLPKISEDHLKKHRSIKKFLVTPKKIRVVARSDDFDVCRITLSWFDMIEKEIENLIIYWSKVAPKKIGGCIMGLPKLEVYHGEFAFNTNYVKDFQFNKAKLLDLFTGNNLYGSKLDFIREYIQNAFDSNRFQLWYELRDLDIQRAMYLKENKENEEISFINPTDLKKQAFDAFPVHIRVKRCEHDYNKFVLEIEDVGIGFDMEGLSAIADIGGGWRNRKNYTKDINRMKQWFRPTGGFGIGIQSAFMLTDSITIISKSTYDCGYKAIIYKDSIKDNMLIEIDHTNKNRGTKVEFEILIQEFLSAEEEKNYFNIKFRGDYFHYNDKLRFIARILESYCEKMFPNALMPIIIENTIDRTKKIQQSRYFFQSDNGKESKNTIDFKRVEDTLPGMDNYKNEFISWSESENELVIWNEKIEAIFYLHLGEKESPRKILANYKNVRVDKDCHEIEPQLPAFPYIFDLTYDILGLKVDKCLVVSRNKFLDNTIFYDGLDIKKLQKAYIVLYLMLKSRGDASYDHLDFSEELLALYYCYEVDLKFENTGIWASKGPAVWKIPHKNADAKNETKDEKEEFIYKQEDITYFEFYEYLKENYILIPSGERIEVELEKTELNMKQQIKINCDKSGYMIRKAEGQFSDLEIYKKGILIRNQNVIEILKEKVLESCVIWAYYEENNKIFRQECSFILNDILKSCIEKKEKVSGEYTNRNEINANKYDFYSHFSRRDQEIMNRDVDKSFYDQVSVLFVKKLPYGEEIKKGCYKIITPYNEAIKMYANDLKNLGLDALKAADRIWEFIQKDSSYNELIRWVLQNSLSETASREEIKKAYEIFVKHDVAGMF